LIHALKEREEDEEKREQGGHAIPMHREVLVVAGERFQRLTERQRQDDREAALKESDRIGDTAVIRHWDIPDKSLPVEQCGGAKRNSPLEKERRVTFARRCRSSGMLLFSVIDLTLVLLLDHWAGAC
jgi:hypothetical protein